MRLLKKVLFRKRPQNTTAFYQRITQLLGEAPQDITLYEEAFTHPTAGRRNEFKQLVSYERLEFLGDSILGSVIAHFLFLNKPSKNEGYLTTTRSKIVSRDHLDELGRDYKLKELVMSSTQKTQLGAHIEGNLFEALCGAIYLDKGYDFFYIFVNDKVIKPYVDLERLEGKIHSYKSLFIEYCQKHKLRYRFDVRADHGPEPQPHFSVRLFMEEKIVAKSRDTSKKRAEEKASKRAYFALQPRMDKFRS